MIAVKRGAPDLTSTLLGGGYDIHVDAQENVSLIVTSIHFVHHCVIVRYIE